MHLFIFACFLVVDQQDPLFLRNLSNGIGDKAEDILIFYLQEY